MTRINTLDPKLLTTKHLQAEYFEAPRIITALEKNPSIKDPPKTYRMGTGHVRFFYDKLDYIALRLHLIADELTARGHQLDEQKFQDTIARAVKFNHCSGYYPSLEDQQVNLERLIEKDPDHYNRVDLIKNCLRTDPDALLCKSNVVQTPLPKLKGRPTMTIKKAYQEIVSLLEANQDSLVSDVIDAVRDLASAKQGGGGKATSFHKGEDGTVLAIHCFYHGVWISPLVVEFGNKASSASGFNSMCKEGVSKWTKQQREFKKAKEQLLADVASGEVSAADVPAIIAELEEAKNAIVPLEGDYQGFENLEDCLADLEERGLIS